MQQWRERTGSPCSPTVATCSTSLTLAAKGCLARNRGNSSEWSTCTRRLAECCRMSAWTLTFLEEAATVKQLDEEDEGFQEDVDPTIHIPHVTHMSAPSSSSAAPLSGEPADASRSGPSSPTAPEDGSSPEAPDRHGSPHPDNSSDSEGETQGPNAMPGYQHVRRLARALVGVRNRQGLSDRRVDGLVALWLALDLPCPTPGEDRSGAVQGNEGEVVHCRSKRLSLMLPSWTQLGPCKLAGHQPFGGGHLQSALPNPSQRHQPTL
ncbi:uncharacterized protein LOC120033059 isoform X1 [Salvelinus namaycush]|uniref:Uncharacterized protein LOC120033057 isoform X1 n=2 Tax=Salvelinus namaycush TaxID=8040 RepID=A0A8U0Q259_SALNM|nr:uncharacterized protein LOC120033057 isoform X1 [Salvelinus namaycush]XP_038835275.1 uncharacterized protein LOC120033059 isoform X1 [Salvelinus namaycush]